MVEGDDNVKLAVLEEKVLNLVEILSKLDDTIEKLSDLSVNVSKMLAVHEEKLELARESATETSKEITLLDTKIVNCEDRISSRVRTLERRVWMAMGMGMIIALFLQIELSTGTIFNSSPKPDIIEVQPRD